MNSHDSDQRNRFAAFQITENDIIALKANSKFAEERLPTLLSELYPKFAAWPEIQAALNDPQLHASRIRHWIRLASGNLGDGFQESAKQLASLFWRHGVPGYALSICHATVTNALLEELSHCRSEGSRLSFSGHRRRNAADEGLRSALNKVAWLDLEVLLEAYWEAVSESRRRTTDQIASAFQEKISGVVKAVANAAGQVETAASSIATTTSQSKASCDTVANAAHDASVNVQAVAAAAEELARSVTQIGLSFPLGRNIDTRRRRCPPDQRRRAGPRGGCCLRVTLKKHGVIKGRQPRFHKRKTDKIDTLANSKRVSDRLWSPQAKVLCSNRGETPGLLKPLVLWSLR